MLGIAIVLHHIHHFMHLSKGQAHAYSSLGCVQDLKKQEFAGSVCSSANVLSAD